MDYTLGKVKEREERKKKDEAQTVNKEMRVRSPAKLFDVRIRQGWVGVEPILGEGGQP